MIQRFTFGCPLPTESVVLPVEPAAAAVPTPRQRQIASAAASARRRIFLRGGTETLVVSRAFMVPGICMFCPAERSASRSIMA